MKRSNQPNVNPRRTWRWRGCLSVALVLALASAVSFGDILKAKDGRVFEGETWQTESGDTVIDTVVANIRVQLLFPAKEIASVEKKPLPAGFYDPPPAPRQSNPSQTAPGDSLYLEVPIKGAFGKNVYAEGVRNALAYAQRYRIPHVVFVIDSTGVNAPDEVRGLYLAMKGHASQLTCHALVKNCLGDALAVLVQCDTLHVEPGASIGGGDYRPAGDEQMTPGLLQDYLAGLALKAVEASEAHGRRGDIARAMIDPQAGVWVWRDAGGQTQTSPERPADVADDQFLLKKEPGKGVLVLNPEQLKAVDAPTVTGGAAALGSALGLANWKLESDYGQKAMANAVTSAAKQVAAEQSQFERQVKENLGRREYVDLALKENLRNAEYWDPEKGTYTLKNWYQTNDRIRTSGTWTQASRQSWSDRSATTLNYIDAALRCVSEMSQLDAQAQKLGLPPTYPAGQLEAMASNLKTRRDHVAANRNRRGE